MDSDNYLARYTVHSLMIPVNSRSCSSSRNIKEFQRDLRFSHSLTVLFTIPPKSTLYLKEKNQDMTNYETQLFSIDHKSPKFFKKKEFFPKPIYRCQILIGGPHPLSPTNTISRLLLADHWAMLLPKPIRACRT